jgi:hypothetical protein
MLPDPDSSPVTLLVSAVDKMNDHFGSTQGFVVAPSNIVAEGSRILAKQLATSDGNDVDFVRQLIDS